MTTSPIARETRSDIAARRTRGLIAELRVDQLPIAQALGMSQPNFSRKVNGHRPFTTDEVTQLLVRAPPGNLDQTGGRGCAVCIHPLPSVYAHQGDEEADD